MSNKLTSLSIITFNDDGSIHNVAQQSVSMGDIEKLANQIGLMLNDSKTVQLQSTLKIIHTISKSNGKLHFDTVDTTDFAPMTRAHSPEFQEERLIEFCKDVVL